MWVTNNEGWGQYDAKTVGSIAKNMDPSRLVNTASGWMDVPDSGSDVYDIHTYDEVPVAPSAHPDRPIVTGEYGGVGPPIQGHLWFTDRDARSEEHTSELQSPMSISYALFCLKKKTQKNKQNIKQH